MKKPDSLLKASHIPFVGVGLLFILGASRCSSIKYEDDLGFLNSAQANSMEWLVTVDDRTCKDMEGNVGACTKRIKSDHSPVLRHDIRPYAYQVRVACTEGTGISFSEDVEAGKGWKYVIPADQVKDFRSFTCYGEIHPQDRDNSLSALWQIRFIVVDQAYRGREVLQGDHRGYVFGRYAKYARACSPKGCKDFKKTTVAKFKNGVRAYSESELLRFNYRGY